MMMRIGSVGSPSISCTAPSKRLLGLTILGMVWLGSGLLAGCKSTGKRYDQPLPPGRHALERVTDARQMPDLHALFPASGATLAAIDESLRYFAKPSSRQHFPYQTPDRTITHDDQVRTLETLRGMCMEARSPEELANWIQAQFDVYRSVGWDGASGEVLFTAYYTPILTGSRTRHGPFQVPLYRRPADLVATEDGKPLGRRLPDGRVAPYPSRVEIECEGLLAGQELVYLEDPFDAYIVHVQGSATIQLDDGGVMHVGYAGKTDRPYRSIGQELIRRRRIPENEMSLARLRRYFREHPDDIPTILGVNESYVFFTESEPGPFGSIGARVTPYHTIATDKSVFPRGGPTIAQTLLPSPAAGGAARPFTGLFLDQDTGGAIRSAGRADLYLGTGPEAERHAGSTRHEGRLYYLFLKDDHAPHLAVSAGPPRPDAVP